MHENRETSEAPAVQPGRRAGGEGLGRMAHTYVPEEQQRVPWKKMLGLQDRWFPLNPARSILVPRFASPPIIRDKNRMR
jgi:hypothetical protein